MVQTGGPEGHELSYDLPPGAAADPWRPGTVDVATVVLCRLCPGGAHESLPGSSPHQVGSRVASLKKRSHHVMWFLFGWCMHVHPGASGFPDTFKMIPKRRFDVWCPTHVHRGPVSPMTRTGPCEHRCFPPNGTRPCHFTLEEHLEPCVVDHMPETHGNSR